MLKPAYADMVKTGITAHGLERLTQVSRAFDELLNRAPDRQAPYVGESAFATKAGIHASALLKEPETYEHVPPQTIGNIRRVLVSDQAGKSNLISEIERAGISVDKSDPRLDTLLRDVKERETAGYAYDAAPASFQILARQALGSATNFFEVDSFRVSVEHRHNAKGEETSVAEAVVKTIIDGKRIMSVGEGNGPINALDTALRKDLGKFQALIEDLELVDYKVRILNGGTGAITRVLIESRDRTGERWFTIGVSPNIVDASFEALLDSVTYKLLKEGAAS